MIREFIQTNPRISIIIISGLVSLFISFINYILLDDEKRTKLMKGKEKQKEFRNMMKEHKGNPSKMMELQKEMMAHNMEFMKENFKHSFRPMLITALPILVVFWWIKDVFPEILPGWFWWYLISAIVFSIAFRKVFKLP